MASFTGLLGRSISSRPVFVVCDLLCMRSSDFWLFCYFILKGGLVLPCFASIPVFSFLEGVVVWRISVYFLDAWVRSNCDSRSAAFGIQPFLSRVG